MEWKVEGGNIYSAQSCSKIIQSQAGEHGCPFRHWDRPHLVKRMITIEGVRKRDVVEILKYVPAHPQLTCPQFLESKHNVKHPVEHPTHFYLNVRKTQI